MTSEMSLGADEHADRHDEPTMTGEHWVFLNQRVSARIKRFPTDRIQESARNGVRNIFDSGDNPCPVF